MKKIIKYGWFTVLVTLLFVNISFVSSAEGTIIDSGSCGDEDNSILWTVYDNGELVISGEGEMENYSSSNENMAPWYSYWRNVTNIKIESGVKSIGDEAFLYFTKVKSVSIPNTIEKIGMYAFDCCFSLTQVEIPDSVLSISEAAFINCDSLEKIIVNDANLNYVSEGGILFNKNKTVLLAFPASNGLNEYTMPNTVERIAVGAFCDCDKLLNINIGDNVKEIGQSAFEGCSGLTEFNITDKVIEVGDRAIYECSNLQTIHIGSSVEVLGYECFADCPSIRAFNVSEENKCYSSDESGVLFDKEKKILIRYPSENKAEKYALPETTEHISEEAFVMAHYLCEVVLPNSLKTIGAYAFENCTSLKSIEIPDSVTSIESYAFAFSGIETAKMSKNSDMGFAQFFCCTNLKDIIIPEGVTSISYYAFDCCFSLKSVTIPHSVVFIDYLAFESCDAIEDVYYYGTEEEWEQIIIRSDNESLTRANIHFLGFEEHEHSYVLVESVEPSCLIEGAMTYVCSCGDEYQEIVKPKGHSFEDGSSKCSNCDYDRSFDCSCNCHKGGIAGFFFKIILFFQKLFRTNKTCACGVAHY